MRFRIALLLVVIVSSGSEYRSHNTLTEGHLRQGEVVFTNDGKCPPGKIARITGGNHSAGIPRKHECVVHQ
jgi:hypothetical protein